jgi:hypothetical protein
LKIRHIQRIYNARTKRECLNCLIKKPLEKGNPKA